MELVNTLDRTVAGFIRDFSKAVLIPDYVTIEIDWDSWNLDDGIQAQCSKVRKRHYLIEFDSVALETDELFIRNLSHELTHVRQFMRNGLKPVGKSGWQFMNARFAYESDLDYWFAPWEVEARGMEQAGWALYCSRINSDASLKIPLDIIKRALYNM